MALFKCKMCGGDLEIAEGVTIAECEYCGTKQTVPKAMDENLQNLFNRANTLRIKSEFDKAEKLYEKIIQADTTQSEAYWGLILCKYGIEYVDDPATFKKIPTCHRASYDSIIADDDYKSAIENADMSQRSIYEEQAKEIDRIQKDILALAQKEETYDVFICYKETDADGHRTQDSVIANDIYYQLTNEGFKVFYAAITLEGKLGSAYEPIIFAALNSAKVMLSIGTKPEYFNAVWVKNEWSRFLKIIKKDRSKLLIPCYRDMDAYELPEEFAHLQAQDMAKIGFINDLVRGIKKVVKKDEPKTTTVVKETVVSSSNANVAPLLKRAFMFLEDGDFSKADDFCEQVLNQDPENAQAYLGKLMAELHVRKQESLKDCDKPFYNNSNYNKVMRFGDDALKNSLTSYIEHINTRNENARLEGAYNQAISKMESAKSEADYKAAADILKTIAHYKNSEALIAKCLENAEVARKDGILSSAKFKMGARNVKACEEAIELLASISGWKDADEQIDVCKRKIEELIAEAEAEKARSDEKAKLRLKRNNKIAIIAISSFCAFIAFIIILNVVIIPIEKKNDFIAAYGQEIYDRFGIVEEGAYIKFGSYEQDNNTSNGKEDIEWLVLEVKDGKALVISKYALDCKPYNTSYNTGVTWKMSTLHLWLNNDFISAAFSDEEISMIPTVTVSADKNPQYSTNPGNETQDQVFLLSIAEANKYFSSDEERECEPTDYANAGYLNGEDGNCWWWLRSPGNRQGSAAFVYGGGTLSDAGCDVDTGNIAVRPALWIDFAASGSN